MQIGIACKLKLSEAALIKGRMICRVSRHICAVIDGVIYDTYDCSSDDSRCVYGYWIQSEVHAQSFWFTLISL